MQFQDDVGRCSSSRVRLRFCSGNQGLGAGCGRYHQQPILLAKTRLENRDLLEETIVADPAIISAEFSEDCMLIGRQVKTSSGGNIDLLAIAPDASLVVIELKKARTLRDVTSQALDYASWISKLRSNDIAEIYARFKLGHSLDEAFKQHFGLPLDADAVNQVHRVIVVASALDDSIGRIIAYFSERGVKINALFFQVFVHGPDKFLSRAWLIGPHAQITAEEAIEREKGEWNGEFYVTFGEGSARSWEDARNLGFISGGGGLWYSRTLKLLNPSDRVWVNVPGQGFVGVGRVTGNAKPASKFTVQTPKGEQPVLEAATMACSSLRKNLLAVQAFPPSYLSVVLGLRYGWFYTLIPLFPFFAIGIGTIVADVIYLTQTRFRCKSCCSSNRRHS